MLTWFRRWLWQRRNPGACWWCGHRLHTGQTKPAGVHYQGKSRKDIVDWCILERWQRWAVKAEVLHRAD